MIQVDTRRYAAIPPAQVLLFDLLHQMDVLNIIIMLALIPL